LDILGHLVDDFLSGQTTTCAGSWLHAQYVGQKSTGLILRSSNLSVLMETKSLWLWIEWERLDIVNVIILFSWLNDVIETTG